MNEIITAEHIEAATRKAFNAYRWPGAKYFLELSENEKRGWRTVVGRHLAEVSTLQFQIGVVKTALTTTEAERDKYAQIFANHEREIVELKDGMREAAELLAEGIQIIEKKDVTLHRLVGELERAKENLEAFHTERHEIEKLLGLAAGGVGYSMLSVIQEEVKEAGALRARMSAFKSAIGNLKAPLSIKAHTKREYWKAGARAVIEEYNKAFDAAIKAGE